MICPSCDCGCLILPYKCLYEKNSNLKRLNIESRPEILNAVNAFVLIGDQTTGGMLGEKCFNELCSDIKQAYNQAEQYRKNNQGSNDAQTEFWYYLAPKWHQLLKNGYFQSMYAAYCLYYYYNLKISHSETTLDGDVQNNRQGGGNEGTGTNQINLEASKAKEAVHLAHAQKYASMFKNLYLQNNLSLYPCLNICACKDINCKGCNIIPNKDGTPKKFPRKPRPTVI